MKKYGEYLETQISTITETMNPFSLYLNKETLFNMGTGKAAIKGAFHSFFYNNVYTKLKTNVTNIQQCPEDNALCVSGKKSKFKNP